MYLIPNQAKSGQYRYVAPLFMDVTRNQDYIFVHIPRTGGRSILSALGLDDMGSFTHFTILDYFDYLGEQVLRNTYKFAVVRNPWERAFSWWSFFINKWDFETWIVEEATRDYEWVRLRSKCPMDELSYCRDKEGNLLIDSFLRFENLAEDFVSVAERFGISHILPRIGDREKEDYRKMYKSQRSIDAVASMNAELIERFGYQF